MDLFFWSHWIFVWRSLSGRWACSALERPNVDLPLLVNIKNSLLRTSKDVLLRELFP